MFFPPTHLHSFSFYWRKKTKHPKFGLLMCCVSSIDCLASDFANFLDVGFWFCTKEPHFLLEPGPGESSDTGSGEYSLAFPLRPPDPACVSVCPSVPSCPAFPPFISQRRVPGARRLNAPGQPSAAFSAFRERAYNFYTNIG